MSDIILQGGGSIVHPLQADPGFTEERFAFLQRLGFEQTERWVTGGQSFKDGWRLTYERAPVVVTVQYLDSQFEVWFRRAQTEASYLFIDTELRERYSGFHGAIFPPHTLERTIVRVSVDVEANYSALLEGDDEAWREVEARLAQPQRKRRLP